MDWEMKARGYAQDALAMAVSLLIAVGGIAWMTDSWVARGFCLWAAISAVGVARSAMRESSHDD